PGGPGAPRPRFRNSGPRPGGGSGIRSWTAPEGGRNPTRRVESSSTPCGGRVTGNQAASTHPQRHASCLIPGTTAIGSCHMKVLDLQPSSEQNNDASLLEGLYQLVVNGQTDTWEFERLNAEVYDRLAATYSALPPPGSGPARSPRRPLSRAGRACAGCGGRACPCCRAAPATRAPPR